MYLLWKICPNKLCKCTFYKEIATDGLGIAENIVTLCPKCHYEEDFGQDTKLYENYIENYLKGIYGVNWDKSKLIYKKY